MMTRREWAIVCGALVWSCPPLIGAGQAGSPISGVWKGELVPDDSDSPRRVTLTLKGESGGKVSGTMTGMPKPADVKAGTYDAKTGALKLSVGKAEAPAVLIVLEGKVAKDTASGKVSGEMTGTFSITRQP
jgi:hypothetical protein